MWNHYSICHLWQIQYFHMFFHAFSKLDTWFLPSFQAFDPQVTTRLKGIVDLTQFPISQISWGVRTVFHISVSDIFPLQDCNLSKFPKGPAESSSWPIINDPLAFRGLNLLFGIINLSRITQIKTYILSPWLDKPEKTTSGALFWSIKSRIRYSSL